MPKPPKSNQPDTTPPAAFALDSNAGNLRLGGYKQPKTAAAAEPDLFSVGASSDGANGYDAWQQERLEKRRAFELKWGVPVGRRVRVQLASQGRALEGVIRIAETDAEEAGAKDRFLWINGIAFSPREVESLARL